MVDEVLPKSFDDLIKDVHDLYRVSFSILLKY